MKRRQLLGLGALGALGLWGARPNDRGAPYNAYFGQLNDLLKREGAGMPQLVIDLDRLDANAQLLSSRLAQQRLPLRLVAKSLALPGLLEYLAQRLATQRFMVFQQPQLLQLAHGLPQSDLLLGKPMPAAAALDFYQQLPASSSFIPSRQLTWLIDSPQRLRQYADLAQALQQPLQIALEINIGLERGGFADPATLAQALRELHSSQAPLQVRGLMGYDAQVAHAPFWLQPRSAFDTCNSRYRAFMAAAAAVPGWPTAPLLNGAGSLTYPLHAQYPTPLNEVAVGSALLKPSEFDTELLSQHQPALWIATPVLKAQGGQLPYLQAVQPLLEQWDANRQRAYYLYGGRWPAEPIAPPGLTNDPLYGRSANQERLIGSAQTALTVDDWVFLRPQLSENLFNLFSEARLLRKDRLVGKWTMARST